MEKSQYIKYLSARELEEREKLKFMSFGGVFRFKTPLTLPNSQNLGTYYVKSRQYQNAYIGEEDETSIISPKADMVVKLIKESKGISVVYSQFVGIGGISIIERKLVENGYTPFNKDFKNKKSYSVIIGGQKQEERDEILKTITSTENKYGDIISVLLISKTGAEGIDLKNIRTIIVLEPYWDKAREDQVIHRGNRLGSHDALPKIDRDIQPYLLISTPNSYIYKEIPNKNREKETVDQMFHRNALKTQQLNNISRDFLKTISIECALNDYGNCHVCTPTNEKLYTDDILSSLKIKSKCIKLKEVPIEVDGEIEYNGEKYKYKKITDGYKIYKYNEQFTAWDELPKYNKLTNVIIKLLNAK